MRGFKKLVILVLVMAMMAQTYIPTLGVQSTFAKETDNQGPSVVKDGENKYVVNADGSLFTGVYNDYCYKDGVKYINSSLKSAKNISNYSKKKKTIKYFTLKVDGKTYAFNEKGKVYKKTIIGNYFFDETGIRCNDEVVKNAVRFVLNHGGKNNSRASKLKKCFNYLSSRKHYSHDTDHTAKLATTSGLPKAANKFLKKANSGKGNCFGWASAFAYIGKVLGYDVKVCKGTTRLVSGGYGPHGWTYIKYSGSYKVCDPNMNYKKNCWMKSYKSYPFSLGKSKTYFKLKIKNGKASWSK
ncbi:MAG: transglutaminase-like domain-containing protein [Lachnospiraceae bacterium]|nr:transglutaminase-like domain-containing protein [Lachnospiraceae bacterium]